MPSPQPIHTDFDNGGLDTIRHIDGIARNGIRRRSYSYSVIGSPNHPVTYVIGAIAARFANWLNNGQPDRASKL